MPPVTARDEPWPFFLFWRHHLWPKLTSSILNVCRRKKSFQWCPDQGDRPNGALYMHKNAQKVEWKTRSKISCHYTWMLHAKNNPSRWRFLRSFLNASKPSRRSITAAKIREKEKKERRKKKIQKSKSLKTKVTFSSKSQISNFCTCPRHNALKRDAGGKKASSCVANAFSTGLKAIWPRSSLKITKMWEKTHFSQKVPGVNGLIEPNHLK